jgi:Protein of unknown function (DUF2973)
MFHILYLVAFAILAFLAIGNLIRSLLHFSVEAQRPTSTMISRVAHPELLDDNGRLSEEPLLVMKSIGLEDARSRLDALYNDTPSYTPESDDG